MLIRRVEGDVLRLVARYRSIPTPALPEATPINRGSVAGRSVVDRKTIHVHDLASADEADFPFGGAYARQVGYRTSLSTPLLREGRAIGTIGIRRRVVRPFTDKQIKLLETFAAQAAIAIENVRLFKETKEALDQQKASAEVLQVISSSVADTTPVFEKILESLERLFEGLNVGVCLVGDDGAIHLGAYRGPNREEFMRHFPVPLSEESSSGAAILQRRVAHYPDVEGGLNVPEYARRGTRITGNKSLITAPMLWEGRGIGSIFVGRATVGEFTEKEIALLKTFADQTVIAIQNARLFQELEAKNRELTEALEQQTATAEILRVISSSPTDVQPVFDAIARSGVHLFQGMSVSLRLAKGDRLERVAFAAGPGCEVIEDSLKLPLPLNDRTFAGRAVSRGEVVHAADVFAEDWVGEESRKLAEREGWRACAAAPLLRENKALGAIIVSRAEPRPFSTKEVALLRTFADQAVIAIENARLFNETKEALDHQKASAEVLQVISSSVADTKPVFEKILESSERLFAGRNLGICLVGDDGAIHVSAYHGPNRGEVMRRFPLPLSEASGNGTAILQRRIVHYPDRDAEGVPDYVRRGVGGNRSLLFAPMLWEGRGIGSIFVGRATVGEFSEKEIALLKTFADQAVIAIQNARLFNETKEASSSGRPRQRRS